MEWMKYAPELFYATTSGSDYIREQLEVELAPLLPEGVAAGQLRIRADLLTAREAATGRPSYLVLFENEMGEDEPVLENGEVVFFQPEFSSSPAGAREAQGRKVL